MANKPASGKAAKKKVAKKKATPAARRTAKTDARSKNRGGRGKKTEMTPAKEREVLATVRDGVHPMQAFVAAGFHHAVYYRMRDRARQGEEPESELFVRIDQAVAQGEVSDVQATKRAAELEVGEVKCKCGRKVKLKASEAAALHGSLSDAQRAKAGAANIALERLARRFPARWSMKVQHEVSAAHDRFLDVAQRVLAPEVFELLLSAYLGGEGEGEAPEAAGEPYSPLH